MCFTFVLCSPTITYSAAIYLAASRSFSRAGLFREAQTSPSKYCTVILSKCCCFAARLWFCLVFGPLRSVPHQLVHNSCMPPFSDNGDAKFLELFFPRVYMARPNADAKRRKLNSNFQLAFRFSTSLRGLALTA